MNERIKELADKAFVTVTSGGGFSSGEFCEKFAELIVRECVKLLPPEMTHGPDGRPLEQVFKQHFGIGL